jgi:HSP20 family protein
VRKFRLPVAVDHDKVEATLKEGVLYVTMAKSESAKPRKIAVKAG